MIYTSNYTSINSDNFNTISISWDKGKDAGYAGSCIQKLAPKLSFWRTWKKNRGLISDIDNNKYYIEEYYKQVLSFLDPCEIYNQLDNKILLCYENNMDFCHRHIVSAWLELFLNIDVLEVKEINESLKIYEKPLYIKNILEGVIKDNMNMNGFKSIRAAYLYNLSKNTNNRELSDLLLYEANEVEDNLFYKIKINK